MNATLERPRSGRAIRVSPEDGREDKWVDVPDGVSDMSVREVFAASETTVAGTSNVNLRGNVAGLDDRVRPGESVSLTRKGSMG